MAKKKQMSWNADVDEMWKKFEAAVVGETPRGMAMVHGALIEDAIMRLLLNYLVPGPGLKALTDGFNSPVGNWSARTNLAHAVGLISDDEKDATDLLRDIRNMFAHSMSATYEDQSVTDRLGNFNEKLGGDRQVPIAMQYQMLVSFLAASFFNRVSEIGRDDDRQFRPLELLPSQSRRTLPGVKT